MKKKRDTNMLATEWIRFTELWVEYGARVDLWHMSDTYKA